ncbi:helix-turn-helix domain-containing protein [Lacticaseibacillus thailandensis]|nr:AraC family transcriptional regulator [Lacticaseibacillus thailandensis]
MKIVHEIVQTNANLPFMYYLHNEDSRIDVVPHWHQGIEVNMLVEGMPLKFVTDGVTHQYVPGDVWAVNSRAVHSASGIDHGGWREFGFIIDADFMARNYPDLANLELQLQGFVAGTPYRELVHHMQEMMELTDGTSDPATRFVVLGHFYAVLGILFGHFAHAKVAPKVSNNAGLVDRMMGAIMQRYAEPITGRSLAAEFHTSLTTVNSQFNDAIQMPVSRYIRLVRLLNARKLLLSTNQPVTLIATACGFSSEKTLMRNFKQWKGVTPSVYRDRYARYHQNETQHF